MSYSSEVLADSPLWWGRLGEASGTVMTDSSGNGRNGTYSGGPTLGVAGLLVGDANTAVDWSSGTQRGDIADGAWMDVATVTLEAWIKPDNLTANRTIAARDNGNSTDGRWWILRTVSTGKAEFVFWTAADQSTARLVTGSTSLSVGSTYHIVGTYDGTTARLYVNGVQDASLAVSGALRTDASGIIRIALEPTGGSAFFDGVIDEPAIYSGALSATRVSAHYTAGTTVPVVTSSYMPDVVVEIAFNAGYSTPAASRTWTDVSSYAELSEGLTITHGRGDELSTAEPNSCTVTLDNSDGRFTPGLSTSPYYPNVKIGRPIRITSTPVAGSAAVRFVGYIEEWPVEWSEGTDNYAVARIQAYSRMARMGLSASLQNVVYEEFKRDSPATHYMLDNTSDSVAGGTSLAQAGTGTAVVFTGTGPGTDGISAATFAGGKFLRVDTIPVFDAVECYFLRNGIPTTQEALLVAADNASTVAIILDSVDGGFMVYKVGVGGQNYTTNVCNNVTHHLMWQLSTGKVWIDGTLVIDAGASYEATLSGPVFLRVGGSALVPGTSLTGTVAHVATYASVPSATRIQAHADVGLNTYKGETAEARLQRYAAYAGIPAAEQSISTAADTPMDHIDTTGKGAAELMRTVEATDGGVLYDARDGTLTYAARSARYTATTALSLPAHWVDAPTPKLDRFGLVNDVTATVTGTETSVHALDQASIDDYGLAGSQIELATTDEGEAHAAAWWKVGAYKTPTARVSSLGLDLLPLALANQTAVFGMTIGSKVEITGLPSQAAASTARYFVEGYTETLGMESYRFELNVSPASIAEAVLILDDSTRGQLDQEVLGY